MVKHRINTPADDAADARAENQSAAIKKAIARAGVGGAGMKTTREGRLPVVPNPWGLSPTQVYALRGLIKGKTFTQLAGEMCISVKTLSTYMTRARDKMAVDTVYAMMIMWWRFDCNAEGVNEVVTERVQHALTAIQQAKQALALAEEALSKLYAEQPSAEG